MAEELSIETDSYSRWRAQLKQRAVYVYVLRSDSYVKVGIAADVAIRVCELQVGNPIRLKIEFISRSMPRTAAVRVEKLVGRALKDQSVSGEWFRCSPSDAVAAIQANIKHVRGAQQ